MILGVPLRDVVLVLAGAGGRFSGSRLSGRLAGSTRSRRAIYWLSKPR